jgi:hypothetical protein
MRAAGLKVGVVTNQSGLARGMFSHPLQRLARARHGPDLVGRPVVRHVLDQGAVAIEQDRVKEPLSWTDSRW